MQRDEQEVYGSRCATEYGGHMNTCIQSYYLTTNNHIMILEVIYSPKVFSDTSMSVNIWL